MIGIPRSIVSKTELQFDIEAGLNIVNSLIEQKLFGPHATQLCITSREGCKNPLYDGVGSRKYPEKDYYIVNDIFKNTVFETSLNQINHGRVRLMYMEPKTCYSLHRDDTERVHVALTTNPGAYLLVEASQHKLWKVHIPVDGCGYRVDTRLPHTAINSGGSHRIHLLINLQ